MVYSSKPPNDQSTLSLRIGHSVRQRITPYFYTQNTQIPLQQITTRQNEKKNPINFLLLKHDGSSWTLVVLAVELRRFPSGCSVAGRRMGGKEGFACHGKGSRRVYCDGGIFGVSWLTVFRCPPLEPNQVQFDDEGA